MGHARRTTFVAAIAAGLMAVAIPAFATTVPVGGGTWSYGVGSGEVWSDYLHPNVCHGSTAVGQYSVRSPNTSPGQWSHASAPLRSNGGNQSYWRTTC